MQVCLEGQIPSSSAKKSLSEGHQPYGDQIPWKFAEQFRDTVFPTLSGARIVRIATHPSAMKVKFSLCISVLFKKLLYNIETKDLIKPFEITFYSTLLLTTFRTAWIWFNGCGTFDKVNYFYLLLDPFHWVKYTVQGLF